MSIIPLSPHCLGLELEIPGFQRETPSQKPKEAEASKLKTFSVYPEELAVKKGSLRWGPHGSQLVHTLREFKSDGQPGARVMWRGLTNHRS